MSGRACIRACVCVCVCACVRAGQCACARVRVGEYVRACVCARARRHAGGGDACESGSGTCHPPERPQRSHRRPLRSHCCPPARPSAWPSRYWSRTRARARQGTHGCRAPSLRNVTVALTRRRRGADAANAAKTTPGALPCSGAAARHPLQTTLGSCQPAAWRSLLHQSQHLRDISGLC